MIPVMATKDDFTLTSADSGDLREMLLDRVIKMRNLRTLGPPLSPSSCLFGGLRVRRTPQFPSAEGEL